MSPEWTTYTYDSYGRKSTQTTADSLVTTYSYNDNTLETVVTVSKGGKAITSKKRHNALGELKESEDDEGNTIYHVYYPDGQLKATYVSPHTFGRMVAQMNTQAGKTFSHSFDYDWFGRPYTRTYPSGFEIQYSYTSNGDLDKVEGGGLSLWDCSAVNALGQDTVYSQGGYTTSVDYNSYGELAGITTGSIVDIVSLQN